MKDVQQVMQGLLNRVVEEGRERGIQVAAYYQGELVVDAWAGTADRETGRAVDASTLFPVFSTTKGMTATLLHILAERKLLDYDQRIGEIWPEFAVNGKERATIRQAMNHTLGIPHMPEGIGPFDIGDWSLMRDAVARLEPQWPPGERMEYHAITFGWILGEIAARVSGRPFARLLKETICDPLGIRDLYVGLPDGEEHRVAVLEEPGYRPPSEPLRGPQPIPAWIRPLHGWMNTAEARRACVPASSGIMTARAAAKHYAALLPGGVDGVELLPPERVRLATEPLQLPGQPPHTMALGYWTGSPDSVMGARPTVFGHGGYGGSQAFGDPENRLAIAVANNLYHPGSSVGLVIRELKQALGIWE